MPVSAACRLYHLSRSAYYSWKDRVNGTSGDCERVKQDKAIKLMITELISRFTYIPGKRRLRDLIIRSYGLSFSVERIARLMKEMNIKATTSRRRDAYKGEIANLHCCCALANYVRRDFYIGCRCVILTDITYIPYGLKQDKFAYLCTFYDPYTKEVLGWCVSDSMGVELVRNAHQDMMNHHGSEFPHDRQYYIHSDQGSQYLSAEYKELFTENAVQSMSRRGNIQDNACQESFFGRLKERTSSYYSLCEELEQIRTMVDTYIRQYNEEIPQEQLGGLTPSLFYQYKMTGVFPLKEYFGVPAEELNSLNDVISQMQHRAKQKARERSEKRRTSLVNPDRKDPITQIRRDLAKLDRHIASLERRGARIEVRIETCREIRQKAEKAMEYVLTLRPEQLEELSSSTGWDQIPELSYVKDFHTAFYAV